VKRRLREGSFAAGECLRPVKVRCFGVDLRLSLGDSSPESDCSARVWHATIAEHLRRLARCIDVALAKVGEHWRCMRAELRVEAGGRANVARMCANAEEPMQQRSENGKFAAGPHCTLGSQWPKVGAWGADARPEQQAGRQAGRRATGDSQATGGQYCAIGAPLSWARDKKQQQLSPLNGRRGV